MHEWKWSSSSSYFLFQGNDGRSESNDQQCLHGRLEGRSGFNLKQLIAFFQRCFLPMINYTMDMNSPGDQCEYGWCLSFGWYFIDFLIPIIQSPGLFISLLYHIIGISNKQVSKDVQCIQNIWHHDISAPNVVTPFCGKQVELFTLGSIICIYDLFVKASILHSFAWHDHHCLLCQKSWST